jgi:regulator of protease activity HflC (stomatin/prohibitin superfamily)
MQVIAFLFLFFILVAVFKCMVIVPQKNAYIVERLGRYSRTLSAGMHLLLPFIDVIRYKQNLKEIALDVDKQQCVTKDNIIVEIDGILYLMVTDPVKASYGIQDYLFACSQLAQTTMRSEVGKLELDRTFEERASINSAICDVVDKASDPWGVKVIRYEIKTITPPTSVLDAMEKQMRAEREKRAKIAESEGERQSRINQADGEKQEAIAKSEGEKARRINEAEGRSTEIRLVAEATAEGIRAIAAALNEPGGQEAMRQKLAEQYIAEFGKLAQKSNSLVLPANVADIASMVKVALSAASKQDGTPNA